MPSKVAHDEREKGEGKNNDHDKGDSGQSFVPGEAMAGLSRFAVLLIQVERQIRHDTPSNRLGLILFINVVCAKSRKRIVRLGRKWEVSVSSVCYHRSSIVDGSDPPL